MSRTVSDVVIIGAGIMGCSAAFYLARRKGVRVIVIDKGSIAAGMTKRSGSLIRTHSAHPVEARLALASWRAYKNWKELVGLNCEFTETGFVVVARDERDAVRLRAQVDQLQEIGANTRIISTGDLKELQPAARVDDLSIAAYEPEAGFLDPVLAAQSLATRAKELGVSFKTGTLAKSIRVENGRISGVDTNNGLIDALQVVVMAGAWSDRLLKPLGVEIGIISQRVEVMFYDRPSELRAGHAAFEDWATGAHFRPHIFGLTMGGLTAPQSDYATDPDRFEETISQDAIADLQKRLAARLPDLARARYIRGHAGVYDTSPDGHAVLGRVPNIPGLIVAAGFGGAGFALAPAVGACTSELVVDGEASSVDVTTLGISRFQK
jgi:sarcosine oxidase, subunit beta